MTRTAQPAYRAIRNKLLISCATAALAVAVPQKAGAQTAPGAFRGTPSASTGTVDYSRGTTTETITVSSPTATIDWSPYDNATATAAARRSTKR